MEAFESVTLPVSRLQEVYSAAKKELDDVWDELKKWADDIFKEQQRVYDEIMEKEKADLDLYLARNDEYMKAIKEWEKKPFCRGQKPVAPFPPRCSFAAFYKCPRGYELTAIEGIRHEIETMLSACDEIGGGLVDNGVITLSQKQFERMKAFSRGEVIDSYVKLARQ